MKSSPLLYRYKGLVSASLIQQIYEVAHALAGLHVLHVNTTAQGGGVAEILSDRAEVPLFEMPSRRFTRTTPREQAYFASYG